MLQNLLSSRLHIPLMPGTKSAHVIVQSFYLYLGIHIYRVAACCVEVRWIPTTPSIRDARLGLIFFGVIVIDWRQQNGRIHFIERVFLELPASQPRDNSKNRSETPSTTSTTSKENYTKKGSLNPLVLLNFSVSQKRKGGGAAQDFRTSIRKTHCCCCCRDSGGGETNETKERKKTLGPIYPFYPI